MVANMHAKLLRAFLVSAFAAMAAASPAGAQQNTSLYTSVAPKGCKKFETTKVAGDEIALSHDCRGLPGYLVVVSEDDLRTFVAVGTSRQNAKDQPAGNQGFAPFNSVHDNLEWRLDAKTKKPFATIQRWFIADNENQGPKGPKDVPILVVQRLSPACHVAYIDASANTDANVLAAQAADEKADAFKCGKDEVAVVGEKGRGIELAVPQ
jgi:hypothetical protein